MLLPPLRNHSKITSLERRGGEVIKNGDILVNDSPSLLYRLHVLIKIKTLQMLLSRITVNRPSPSVFTRKLFMMCQNVKLPSAICHDTCQPVCRTLVSILAEHFRRTLLNILHKFGAEHFLFFFFI